MNAGTGESAFGSQAVADFAVGVAWDAVPEDVRNRTRLLFADTIGVTLAGSRTQSASAVATSLGAPEAAGSFSVASRAMQLATAASALDFDDGHVWGGGIHPSGVVVSAVVAAAHGRALTAGQLLCAQLVGYEVAVRAGRLLYPSGSGHTYHCAGTAGCLGAAVAVARILGADAEVTRRALEIASAYAPMSTFALPMVKESMGWGALTSVVAAKLAVGGFNSYPGGGRPGGGPTAFGPPTPFDGAGAGMEPDVDSLGSRWQILTGYVKPYASCRFTHAPADGLLQIMAEHALESDEIESVKVRTHEASAGLDELDPPTLEHAQYSIPFVLGTVLVSGSGGVVALGEGTLGDERVLARARDVLVEHEPALDQHYPAAYPAEVIVTCVDGRTFRDLRTDIRGEPALPMSETDLLDKFVVNTGSNLGKRGAERFFRLCMEFDDGGVEELIHEFLRLADQRT